MWAAFFVSFLWSLLSRKMFSTFSPTRAFVNARAQSSVKIKEQPYKESFLGVSEKKDLTEAQYYNMHHRKYPYCVWEYNKGVGWQNKAVSWYPYCIFSLLLHDYGLQPLGKPLRSPHCFYEHFILLEVKGLTLCIYSKKLIIACLFCL